MGFFSDLVKGATLGMIDLEGDEKPFREPAAATQARIASGNIRPGDITKQRRRITFEEVARTEQLRKQLEPFQLIAQGLTKDEQGNIVQATAEERASFQTPEARLAQQNLMATLQGEQALLRGELPAGVEQALRLQEKRALGLGLETTARRGGLGGTAEAQLRGRLLESGLLTRGQLLGQELSRFSGIAGQQRGLQAGLLQQRLQNLQGQIGAGQPLLAASIQAQQPVLEGAQLIEQVKAQKAQRSAAQLQGIGQIAGLGAGLALAPFTGGASLLGAGGAGAAGGAGGFVNLGGSGASLL